MRGFDEVLRVGRLMQEFDRPWGFCGGWAIDLFLGRVTRLHGDVDIAVLRRDQAAIREYLTERGWFLEIAHQGLLTVWPDGVLLELPLQTVWASNQAHDPSFIEVLLHESHGPQLLVCQEPSLSVPVAAAFVQSAGEIPGLAPEIVLLYQAGVPEDRDFEAVLSALGARREWLAVGLEKLHPGHRWLTRLATGRPT